MGPLTPIIALRLLALAAGLRHNAEIGQPGLCFSAYGHKFGINHPHVHHEHTDAFYVLEGELTFETGREAETITVPAGGFVAVCHRG